MSVTSISSSIGIDGPAVVCGPGTGGVDSLRLPKGSVARELFESPWKFEFFEAVSLLQQLAVTGNSQAQAAIGEFARPSSEALRFSVPHSQNFPAATLQGIEWNGAEERPVVQINFIGLTGASGTLPSCYSERLQRIELAARHGEKHALRDWLDNFNHRMASLFYEAWSKYRFPVSVDNERLRSSAHHHPHRTPLIRVALASVAGLDPVATHQPQREATIERDELLGLAGMLAQRPMNVSNLEAAIERCLDVDAKIHEFQPAWLTLDSESQTRLGVDQCTLGQDTVLGERIWDRQQKIRVEVGPLGKERFDTFLPPSEESSGDGYSRLSELVRVCVGDSLEFDVQPLLRIDRPLEVQLTAQAGAQRLGIDTWLGAPADIDVASDAVFSANHGSGDLDEACRES